MAEETKFTEEELKSINEVAESYTSLQDELGNLGVQKILVDERIKAITEREEAIRGEWKANQVKGHINACRAHWGRGVCIF